MKFCKNCGNELLDTAAFCPKCGTAAENPAPTQATPAPEANQQPQYQQAPNYQAPNYQAPNYNQYQPQQQGYNQYQPQQNYYQPAQDVNNFNEAPEVDVPVGKGIKALVFGILSILLCYIPVLGIIFSRIAKKSAVEILSVNPHGAAKGLAKAGKITSAIGFPFSIIGTIIMGLYFIIYYLAFMAMMM